MANLLMVYQTTDGQTRKMVEFMADHARSAGHEVEMSDSSRWSVPVSGCGYDAILLAASVHVGRHADAATRFVRAYSEALRKTPSAFVSVSLSAASEESKEKAQAYVAAFLEETGWYPDLTSTVAGALRYSRYSFIKRMMMKQIAAQSGLPTNTSRDYEFTDWDELRRITERLITLADRSACVEVRA